MAERNTNSTKTKRLLNEPKRDYIKFCLDEISMSKKMISAINRVALKFPNLSELAGELIELEKKNITAMQEGIIHA